MQEVTMKQFLCYYSENIVTEEDIYEKFSSCELENWFVYASKREMLYLHYQHDMVVMEQGQYKDTNRMFPQFIPLTEKDGEIVYDVDYILKHGVRIH